MQRNSIQTIAGSLKQGLNFFGNGVMFRLCKLRVRGKHFIGGAARLVHQFHIAFEVCYLQIRQAMLALAEEVAGAPQIQILLGNFEAIVGARHGFQSGAGGVVFYIGK